MVALILLGALFTIGAGIRALSIRFTVFSDNLRYYGEFDIDGDYVVWVGLEEDYKDMVDAPGKDLYLYQISTGVISNLTDGEGEQAYDYPQIVEDFVVWDFYTPEEEWKIQLHQISTGITKPIVKGNLADLNEEYIVYYEYWVGDASVWLYELETGESKQIHTHSGFYRSAQVDGDYVVWVTGTNIKKEDSGKDYELHMYQISTGNTTQLTHNAVYDGWPDLEGDYVVWFGEEAGNKDVYLYQISTGITKKLTGDQTEDGPPKISGDYVVWSSMEPSRDSKAVITLYRISTGEMIEVVPIDDHYYGHFIQIDGDYIVWFDEDGEVTLYQISSSTTMSLSSQNRNIGPFELSGNFIAGEVLFDGMFVLELIGTEESDTLFDCGYDPKQLIGWVDPYRNVPE